MTTIASMGEMLSSVMPDTRTLVQIEMIVVAISTKSTAIHKIVFQIENIVQHLYKITFSFFTSKHS